MAIFAITGKPRHGKTYLLAKKITKMLKNNERVFSNLKLNLGQGSLKKFDDSIIGDLYNKEDFNNPKKLLFYWRHIHEWEHMKKGNIIVDEMTRYFNPRQWASLSEDTEIKLQQHGKEDLNIWGTVQKYDRIDVTLRILVERFYIVKTVWGNPDNHKPLFGIKLFKIIDIDLDDIDGYYQSIRFPEMKMELDYKQKYNFFHKKYAQIYDTRQMVGRSDSVPLVHKVRICPECNKEMITHV